MPFLRALCILVLPIGLTSDLMFAQQLDQEKITDEISKRYPAAKLDDNTLYVLNGVPFQKEYFNSELSIYKKSDLCLVQYLDSSRMKENTWLGYSSSIVIITTDSKAYGKTQGEEFEAIAKLFQQDKDIGDLPALTINDELVEPDRSIEIISELKRKKTECINNIKSVVSTDYFGKNGMNGLVEIKTKKRRPLTKI